MQAPHWCDTPFIFGCHWFSRVSPWALCPLPTWWPVKRTILSIGLLCAWIHSHSLFIIWLVKLIFNLKQNNYLLGRSWRCRMFVRENMFRRPLKLNRRSMLRMPKVSFWRYKLFILGDWKTTWCSRNFGGDWRSTVQASHFRWSLWVFQDP